jgi:hypothetical protein
LNLVPAAELLELEKLLVVHRDIDRNPHVKSANLKRQCAMTKVEVEWLAWSMMERDWMQVLRRSSLKAQAVTRRGTGTGARRGLVKSDSTGVAGGGGGGHEV